MAHPRGFGTRFLKRVDVNPYNHQQQTGPYANSSAMTPYFAPTRPATTFIQQPLPPRSPMNIKSSSLPVDKYGAPLPPSTRYSELPREEIDNQYPSFDNWLPIEKSIPRLACLKSDRKSITLNDKQEDPAHITLKAPLKRAKETYLYLSKKEFAKAKEKFEKLPNEITPSQAAPLNRASSTGNIRAALQTKTLKLGVLLPESAPIPVNKAEVYLQQLSQLSPTPQGTKPSDFPHSEDHALGWYATESLNAQDMTQRAEVPTKATARVYRSAFKAKSFFRLPSPTPRTKIAETLAREAEQTKVHIVRVN